MSDHYLLKLVTEARVCRADAEANARRAETAERELAAVREQRDKAEAIASDRGEALDKTEDKLAARGEQLHEVMGERNRLQVSEREARELAAELARLRDHDSELLEAERGLFVPIPASHMLSVTVTPYYPEPVDAEVVSE